MSNSFKVIMALGVAAFISACSQQQPPETVVVEPVVAEQPTTKY